jgi:hypothetical protein
MMTASTGDGISDDICCPGGTIQDSTPVSQVRLQRGILFDYRHVNDFFSAIILIGYLRKKDVSVIID